MSETKRPNAQGVGSHPLAFEIGVGVDTEDLLLTQMCCMAFEDTAEASMLLIKDILQTVEAEHPGTWRKIITHVTLLMMMPDDV